jgi:hypothetical protein
MAHHDRVFTGVDTLADADAFIPLGGKPPGDQGIGTSVGEEVAHARDHRGLGTACSAPAEVMETTLQEEVILGIDAHVEVVAVDVLHDGALRCRTGWRPDAHQARLQHRDQGLEGSLGSDDEAGKPGVEDRTVTYRSYGDRPVAVVLFDDLHEQLAWVVHRGLSDAMLGHVLVGFLDVFPGDPLCEDGLVHVPHPEEDHTVILLVELVLASGIVRGHALETLMVHEAVPHLVGVYVEKSRNFDHCHGIIPLCVGLALCRWRARRSLEVPARGARDLRPRVP